MKQELSLASFHFAPPRSFFFSCETRTLSTRRVLSASEKDVCGRRPLAGGGVWTPNGRQKAKVRDEGKERMGNE